MLNSRAVLAYLGSLPFIFLTLCLVFDINVLPIVGDVTRALSSYTLIIAAFMAGSHWGQQLSMSGLWAIKLKSISNINALSLWFGFILLPNAWFLWCAIASFLLSLWLDYQLKQAKFISADYWLMRVRVTIIVVGALAVASVRV